MKNKTEMKKLSDSELREKYTNEQKQELIKAAGEIGHACRCILEDINQYASDMCMEDNPMLYLVMRVYGYRESVGYTEYYFKPDGLPYNPICEENCEDLREIATHLRDEFECLVHDGNGKNDLDRLVEAANSGQALRTRFDAEINGGDQNG